MSKEKYVGLDVHKATIVIAVLNAVGQVVMQTVIATDAQMLREFFKGLSGTVSVALEEGTQSAWLYALLKPLVKDVVVCNPRHNKLLEVGNKGDQIDALKLAHLLRLARAQGRLQRQSRATPVEGFGARLSKPGLGFDPHHESDQGHLSWARHQLRRAQHI